jgi:hypothetical protein
LCTISIPQFIRVQCQPTGTLEIPGC